MTFLKRVVNKIKKFWSNWEELLMIINGIQIISFSSGLV